MLKFMRKAIVFLLVCSIVAGFCACGVSDTEDSIADRQITDSTLNDLSEDLLQATECLLSLCDGEVATPDTPYAPNITADDGDDDIIIHIDNEDDSDDRPKEFTVDEIRELFGDDIKKAVTMQKEYKTLISSEDHSLNVLNDDDLTETFEILGDLAKDVLIHTATMVVAQLATYCINQVVNAVMEKFGIDTRSDSEKILEKLEILDDIYESVTNIEKTVNEMNQRLKDETYYSAVDGRTEELEALSNATCAKYAAVIHTLAEGYDEFVDRYQAFKTYLDTDALENGEISEEDYYEAFVKVVSDEIDEEFLLTVAFMDANDGLNMSNYMTYQLIYHGDNVQEILESWANQIIGGNSICIEVKSLLSTYSGGFSAGGKSYPEIYDYCAYRIYPWEHLGYDFREGMRSADSAIMSEAYAMANMYYSVCQEKSAESEQENLYSLCQKYNEVQEKNAVVHHDGYYICQIEGCEYVFAKTAVYFDYYSQFKNYLNGCKFDPKSGSQIPESTTKALDELFYDSAIAYLYDELPDDQKSKYTFDHQAIGTAGDPYSQVDWEEVWEFTYKSTDGTDFDIIYLPQSAYVALYEYYEPLGYKSLTEIFENVLGITFTSGTHLVCDNVDSENKYSGNISKCTFIYHQFRLIQNIWSKNSDYIDLRVCVNDKNPSSLYNKRFAGGLNVSTSNYSPINGWGKAENRFGGLMVLGVQRSKIYS